MSTREFFDRLAVLADMIPFDVEPAFTGFGWEGPDVESRPAVAERGEPGDE
ncbi:hypothetical protein [Kyrpidia spormannii]|uniref:Uncharacterized protein n=1 Tax=Kyrpidia spormannii TaxID=2055160 RepID=A0A6F9EFP3_9BACL|nr:hypothetical protein [Kyrpidia spormannii]CAB3395711.1 protein of unknown function [Kyrpidia spormannii]